MILLDTCALLWLAHEPARLSEPTRWRIQQAAVVHVSAISGFEVAIKERAGKLVLPASALDWFAAVVDHHDLTVLDLDLVTSIDAALLPQIHRDPCDRFIIATALRHRLAVVTADARFAQYGVAILS